MRFWVTVLCTFVVCGLFTGWVLRWVSVTLVRKFWKWDLILILGNVSQVMYLYADDAKVYSAITCDSDTCICKKS